MAQTADQARLAGEADRLYDQHAAPLEAAHAGRFIAVSPAGRVLLGDSRMMSPIRCARVRNSGWRSRRRTYLAASTSVTFITTRQ